MASDCCIATLGNPDKEYCNTRHNAGVLLFDYLLNSFQAVSAGKRDGNYLWTANFAAVRINFIRTTTYMNLSGPPIFNFIQNKNISPDRLLVLHDEVDFPPGKVRIKFSGGSAGHKGVESIFSALSVHDFYRIRIGIGKDTKGGRMVADADYVLSPFEPEEQAAVERTFPALLNGVRQWVRGDNNRAFQFVNGPDVNNPS